MACTEQERDKGNSTLSISLKDVRRAISFGKGERADIRFFILSRKRLSNGTSTLPMTSAKTRKKRKTENAMKPHIAARLKYIIAYIARLSKLRR